MKNPITKSFRAIAACFALCLAGVLMLAACGTLSNDGPYRGDAILFRADTTITVSYTVLHAFVKFEYDNRTALAAHPEIRVAADKVRRGAQDWVKSAIALRDAYAADPTPQRRQSLETALLVLQTALNESTRYLANQTQP